MSCSPVDLRDYFFGELAEELRRQADLHVKTCVSCREELDRLRSTQSALLSVADEEIPQRIGFVSDRVYEPSAVRRWWGAFWGSAPRLGFASAAMLSAWALASASGTEFPWVLAMPRSYWGRESGLAWTEHHSQVTVVLRLSMNRGALLKKNSSWSSRHL